MTARIKFLAIAAAAVAIPIVGKVASETAILMTIALVVLIYVAWNEINRR